MIIKVTSEHPHCKGNGRLYYNYRYNMKLVRCLSFLGLIHVIIRK